MLFDIKLLDMSHSNRASQVNYSFIALGYNSRHLFRAAKALSQEIDNLEVEGFRSYLTGSSKSEWCIVEMGKIAEVHFMTRTEME